MSFRSLSLAALLFVTLNSFGLVAATTSSATVSVVRSNVLANQLWPGDFNGDGITDLAGTEPISPGAEHGHVRVMLGLGAGGFKAPVDTTFDGHVVGVADMNGDGKVDLIAQQDQLSPGTFILPGNGDGTFGTAIEVNFFGNLAFAAGVDMDGDGKRDLVTAGSETWSLVISPGNGDFTFGPTVAYPAGATPNGGIIADFNGDGRRDIAITNLDGKSVSIFMNQGALMFAASDIPLDRKATDATVADVNADGKIDLIVSVADGSPSVFGDVWTAGYAYVMTGNGDGTFNLPAKYPVAPGAFAIVVGDFTRDGILDIATGNRSAIAYDDCGPGLKTWDSISVLPGNGEGTFAAASSFSVGNQRDVDGRELRNSITSLNTSDLNGDGRTDLIVSGGVWFFNQPTDPNWAPTVDLGPDVTTNVGEVTLKAVADDVDQDMLTYAWTSSDGTSLPPIPTQCLMSVPDGVHTYTVTVNDGHGHQATDSITVTVDRAGNGYTPPSIAIAAPAGGEIVTAGSPYTIRWTVTPGSTAISEINVYKWFETDPPALIAECSHLAASATSCQWNDPNPLSETAHVAVSVIDSVTTNSITSDRFSIRGAPGGGSLPAGWSHTDVGAVAAAGDASFTNGVFTVRGSGADIWGTADEFHFAYQQLTTQFEIVTRADSVQNVHAWTKAGLMVRTSLNPSAAQASIFVTPGKGVSFQRRLNQSAASVSTTVAGITAPVWLRLTGFNGRIWAYYKKNLTDRWTLVGSDVLSNYTAAFVGLAVTSHADGTVATATFSQLRSGAIPDWRFGGGIGCGACGASYDGTVFGLFARSSDIWGLADAFEYIATPINGDATITARVDQVDNTHAWAKAGVMFRETKETGARNVLAMVTPGNGVNLQYRSVTNGQSVRAASIAGTAPGWLRLRRAGHTFTASWSTDGVTFVPIGSITVTMNSGILVGMAFTSHNTSVSGGSLFEESYIIQ
jgi:hypothetical protein